MSLLETTVREAELRFIHVAGGQDVLKARTVEWNETVDGKIPQWGATLMNPRARLAGRVKDLDRVECWVRRDAEPALSRVFVGMLGKNGQDFRAGALGRYDLSGPCFDGWLERRHLTRTVVDPIDVGTFLHEFMDGNDFGLDLSLVPDPYGETIADMVFDYADWHDVLIRVTESVGAGFHIDADLRLHIYPRGITSSGIVDDGTGFAEWRDVRDAEGVVNVVRGIGGTSKVVASEQTTSTSYYRVTDAIVLTTSFIWPREEMPLLEVWAKSVTGSASGLEVRIESDNGAGARSGVPLARWLFSANEVSGLGAYGTIFFPRHFIGPGTRIHLILHGTTADGVDIGVNGTNVPRYRAYVGYSVASEKHDSASIAAFGRHEGRPLRDANITTLEELDVRLEVILAKYAWPLVVGSFRARDTAYLAAPMGHTIVVNLPEVDASLNGAVLAIVERHHRLRVGGKYELELTVADGEREHELGNHLAVLVRRLEYLEASSLRQNSNALQLLTGADSQQVLESLNTIAATPSGSFVYGTAAYGLADYG